MKANFYSETLLIELSALIFQVKWKENQVLLGLILGQPWPRVLGEEFSRLKTQPNRKIVSARVEPLVELCDNLKRAYFFDEIEHSRLAIDGFSEGYVKKI